MAKHILALETPVTVNEGVFIIRDTSIYTTLLQVACGELQILPPGYGTIGQISVTPGFNLVLNACTMGIMGPTSCSDGCPNLPDGIYHLRYDVSPNNMVFVEYNHMRTTHAINKLNGLYCEVDLKDCLPDQQQVYTLSQLDIIRDYLTVSKSMVEDQKDPEDGVNLYRYAMSLMTKMEGRKHCR